MSEMTCPVCERSADGDHSDCVIEAAFVARYLFRVMEDLSRGILKGIHPSYVAERLRHQPWLERHALDCDADPCVCGTGYDCAPYPMLRHVREKPR